MPLQTYHYNKRDYTVDYRLNQFRHVKKNGEIIFLDFHSEQGDRILARMIRKGHADWKQLHL